MFQVVIFVVDHDRRPELDKNGAYLGGLPAAFQDFLQLMRNCWATEPTDRPTYEAVIGEMRYFSRSPILLNLT